MVACSIVESELGLVCVCVEEEAVSVVCAAVVLSASSLGVRVVSSLDS